MWVFTEEFARQFARHSERVFPILEANNPPTHPVATTLPLMEEKLKLREATRRIRAVSDRAGLKSRFSFCSALAQWFSDVVLVQLLPVPWELVRNANSHSPLQICRIRNPGHRAQQSVS